MSAVMTITNRTKVWLSLIVVAVGAVWGTHEWIGKSHLPRHLMTRAEAQTLQQEIKTAVDTAKAAAQTAADTSSRLFDYIEREQLRGERAALERLQSEMSETLLWESQNGENNLSRARKNDLQRRINDTNERIRCLVTPDAGGC